MNSYSGNQNTNKKYFHSQLQQEEEVFHDLSDILFESFITNGMALKELLWRMERSLIIKALWKFDGHQKEASKILRVKPNTLCIKCKKYNITFKKTPSYL